MSKNGMIGAEILEFGNSHPGLPKLHQHFQNYSHIPQSWWHQRVLCTLFGGTVPVGFAGVGDETEAPHKCSYGRTLGNCQLSNETIFSTGSTYLRIEM